MKSVGHLEICHNRTWGVICANHWTPVEAKVACRQLNATPTDQAVNIDHKNLKTWAEDHVYTEGQGPRTQWLNDIYCKGDERRLIDCWLNSICPNHRSPLKNAYNFAGRNTCFNKLKLAGVSCKGIVVTAILCDRALLS